MIGSAVAGASLVNTVRAGLEGMLLKPIKILPGSACPEQASDQAVAEATLTCLRRAVPAVVGIAFLSGGQVVDSATSRLAAVDTPAAQQALRQRVISNRDAGR